MAEVSFHGLPDKVELDDGVVLRRVSAADLPEQVEVVNASLEALRPWMPWAQEPVTVDGQEEWFRTSEEMWRTGTGFNWALVDPAGRMIGGIGFHVRNGPGVLEIGYWLAADRQGAGLMTRAARALTDVARSVEGVTRVEIHCDPANVRSSAIPRRLGYTLVELRDVEATAPGHTGKHEIWTLELDPAR